MSVAALRVTRESKGSRFPSGLRGGYHGTRTKAVAAMPFAAATPSGKRSNADGSMKTDESMEISVSAQNMIHSTPSTPLTPPTSPAPTAPQSGPSRISSLAGLYPESACADQARRWASLRDSMGAIGAPGNTGRRGESDLRFYSAPGRTELGGNHTDHNHGRVLAAAVDLDCIAAVRRRDDLVVRVRSEGYEAFELDLAELEPRPDEEGSTAALVRGAAGWISDRHAAGGRRVLRGFEANIRSSVLSGSGLSSSAAIEVLFGTILADLSGLSLSAVEIARMGQYAENRFFGKPSGLMDQTASAVGGITAIDFADPESPEVHRIDFDFADYGYSLVVVDSGGSHADLTSDYASIPAEMKAAAAVFGKTHLRGLTRSDLALRATEIRKACGDRAFLRAWHFAGENERAFRMAAALESGRLEEYFGLVRASGDSSWRFLQNLYPPHRPEEQGPGLALALAEEFLSGEGACRVHGGGFAGTVQIYVPTARLAGLRALLEPIFGAGSVIPVSIRPVGAAIIEPSAIP